MKFGISLGVVCLMAMTPMAHAQNMLKDRAQEQIKTQKITIERLNSYQDKLQKKNDPFGVTNKMVQPKTDPYAGNVERASQGFGKPLPEYKTHDVPMKDNTYMNPSLFPIGGAKRAK